MRQLRCGVFGVAVAIIAGGGPVWADAPRPFADRPTTWSEHDDGDVPVAPPPSHIQDLDAALVLRDSLANEVDRVLALEGRSAAEDINAEDEVPCSTWFCPRNHLHPMTPDQVAAGAPADAPRLPLTIVKGKDEGAAIGFQVVDANGHKFMLKFDPVDHLGLATGGEMIGQRFFHAAGYNVPATFLVDLAPADLKLDPRATFLLRGVERRPVTEARVRTRLAGAARLPDGRLRAVAVAWIPGQILGGFDLIGRRAGDPNDRIPHQNRRSLRANWVLFAWLSVLDPSGINTLDSYVSDGDRHRFVRHYHIDFSCAFGSSTSSLQGLHNEGEYPVEVGRTLGALASLGLYQRAFEKERAEWERLVNQYPSVGYFPAERFDPDSYRTNRKLPTHIRMTDRDAYWGAKLVTSFSDAQIAAVVATSGIPRPDVEYLEYALRVRRDILGRRYLRAFAAVENPATTADGLAACFDDLAMARGYLSPRDTRYLFEITDGIGRRLATEMRPAATARTCVPIPRRMSDGTDDGYRIVQIVAQLAGDAGADRDTLTKASRIHLRWRDGEQRFVVVGLDRDE